jgi:copper homeostasis protein
LNLNASFSSGHHVRVTEGLATLKALFGKRKELVEDDIWGLTIMPGSGINSTTLPPLLKALLPLGLREIHLSGGKMVPSSMSFRRDGMGMGAAENGEWVLWCTQEDEILKVRAIADTMWKEYVASTPIY